MAEIAAALVPSMMAPTPLRRGPRARGVAMMAAVPPQTYRRAVAAIAAFDRRAHLARHRRADAVPGRRARRQRADPP